MTKVFKSIHDWQQERDQLGAITLGFVPTMGALHKGHMALINRAQVENERTVVSIFVNPTQFNQSEDLKAYPRLYDQDLQLLEAAGVDYLLCPSYEELYPDQYRYQVEETEFSKELCGLNRPGHFKGMLTIVLKLLLLVQARRSYFGEKDYQQLQLVKDMVAAFFVPTEIVPCPTVREADGLAMSSRNLRLSARGRQQAAWLYHFLKQNLPLTEMAQRLTEKGFSIDYLEERYGRRLVAVNLEGIRLIDNVQAFCV